MMFKKMRPCNCNTTIRVEVAIDDNTAGTATAVALLMIGGTLITASKDIIESFLKGDFEKRGSGRKNHSKED